MNWLNRLFWVQCIDCLNKSADVQLRWDPFLSDMGIDMEMTLCNDCFKQAERDAEAYFGL